MLFQLSKALWSSVGPHGACAPLLVVGVLPINTLLVHPAGTLPTPPPLVTTSVRRWRSTAAWPSKWGTTSGALPAVLRHCLLCWAILLCRVCCLLCSATLTAVLGGCWAVPTTRAPVDASSGLIEDSPELARAAADCVPLTLPPACLSVIVCHLKLCMCFTLHVFSPCRFVIIDLSPVTDIDSSAMHFLGGCTYSFCLHAQLALCLVGPLPHACPSHLRCQLVAPARKACSTMLLRFGMLQTADDFIDELASDGVELVLANPIQQVRRMGSTNSCRPALAPAVAGAADVAAFKRSGLPE